MDPRRTNFFIASRAPADYSDNINDYYDEGPDYWEKIRKVPRVADYENSVYLALGKMRSSFGFEVLWFSAVVSRIFSSLYVIAV